MHFLCLHGKGTVNKIFELQLAAVRLKLGGNHTYRFMEGSIECDPAPELPPSMLEEDEYLEYFDDTKLSTIRYAVDELDAFIETTGPYDGFIGFSQGAMVAATLIVEKQQKKQPIPFKVAIFLCGGRAADPNRLDRDEDIRWMDYASDGEVIGIPTAHVYGRNDDRAPLFGPELSKFCVKGLRSDFEHEGGHDIPGVKDKVGLEKTVQCIQAAIDKVSK